MKSFFGALFTIFMGLFPVALCAISEWLSDEVIAWYHAGEEPEKKSNKNNTLPPTFFSHE